MTPDGRVKVLILDDSLRICASSRLAFQQGMLSFDDHVFNWNVWYMQLKTKSSVYIMLGSVLKMLAEY